MTRIFIVMGEGGCLSTVYADTKDVEVSVVDLDTGDLRNDQHAQVEADHYERLEEDGVLEKVYE